HAQYRFGQHQFSDYHDCRESGRDDSGRQPIAWEADVQDEATTTDEVLCDRIGSAAVIRLNRPKALNSINLPMVRAIRAALDNYADDPSVSAVVLTGEGGRAFCAGGDIRVLFDMGKADDPETTRF